MHDTALDNMQWFLDTYGGDGCGRAVLDVGALDLNGSYRAMCDAAGLDYTGLDLVRGKNVDYVPDDPYCWAELKEASFDIVISGQTFEHIEFPERTMAEIRRVLKPGGLLCVIAPSTGYQHREVIATRPVRIEFDDYRRYDAEESRRLIDGLQELFIGVRLASIWNDMVIVAKKPEAEAPAKGKKTKVANDYAAR